MNEIDITHLMQIIRKEMFVSAKDNPPNRDECRIYFEESRFQGKPYLLPLAFLITKPCRWLLSSGGCTMCGYDLIEDLQFQSNTSDISRQLMNLKRVLNSIDHPHILLSSAGSFLDPYEIDDEGLAAVVKFLHEEVYRRFDFESRSEYLLDRARMKLLTDNGHFEVGVGIGLESVDTDVREYCLNKGSNLEDFTKAVINCNDMNIHPNAYIIIGKPFLTIDEDISDTLSTIDFAFNNGIENVILMVTNIQRYTLTELLCKHGLYRPPNLWSVVEILESIPKNQHHRILLRGYKRAEPHPMRFAHSCDRCNSAIRSALTYFNLTGDISYLTGIRGICDCRKKWKRQREDSTKAVMMNLRERVKHAIEIIYNEEFRGTQWAVK